MSSNRQKFIMPNLTCNYEDKTLVSYRDYDFDIRKLGRERRLSCPECNRFVHLRKGSLGRIAHFAHFPNQQIQNCSISNESREHIECKGYVAQLLENLFSTDQVFPEYTLESGQRADVLLVLPNARIAFEIQFSQQTQEKWEYRTELYKKHGIIPFWILGFRKDIKEFYKDSFSDITIPITMQNAGIELPDSQQNWEKRYEQTPYIWQKQKDKTHIFHFLTYKDQKKGFWVAYLRRIPDKKVLWFGDILAMGSNWSFNEKDFRFEPEEENLFNLKYFERQKKQRAIEEEQKKQNALIQGKLDAEREKRMELRNKLFGWLKVKHEAEIPELIMQYQEHKIDRVFTIKIHPKENEIPDRLIAEVAVYYKFIKIKPIGYEFSYAKDIEPFLREWKFCSDQNKQYVAAQISSGFLARLRQIKVLEKSTSNDKWKVLRKLL